MNQIIISDKDSDALLLKIDFAELNNLVDNYQKAATKESQLTALKLLEQRLQDSLKVVQDAIKRNTP